jgi:Na+-driven multidrug efflux pump
MINSISEPFLALGMVLRGALQGAGDVAVPAAIAALTLWIIRMPLTWLMAVQWNWGATGAWWAMSLSTILSGVLTIIWFKLGRWRTAEV